MSAYKIKRIKCDTCGAAKPHVEFPFTKPGRWHDGERKPTCRLCSRKQYERKTRRRKDRVPIPDFQVCDECKEDKPAAAFRRKQKTSQGLQSTCHKCVTSSRYSQELVYERRCTCHEHAAEHDFNEDLVCKHKGCETTWLGHRDNPLPCVHPARSAA
jgi:hypothetical protein